MNSATLNWAHPIVQEWFTGRFGTATEPQEQGWPHILAKKTTLISAPTGSGKTLAAFLAFGIAMWSQLTIGWQWSRPDTVGTTTAMVVMSATMVIFCALGLLAALPIAWAVLMRFVQRQGLLTLTQATLVRVQHREPSFNMPPSSNGKGARLRTLKSAFKSSRGYQVSTV